MPSKRRKSAMKKEDNSANEPTQNHVSDVKKSNKPIDKSHEHAELFGFNVNSVNPALLFVLLSVGHIASSVVFAYFQEKVSVIEGFTYPKFMTVAQTFTYTICAYIEMAMSGGHLGSVTKPSAPVWRYVVLSMLTVGGMYFTNAGLKYLTYPTRIIFKAGKPVPTMFLEYFYVGKLFSSMEVIGVGVLTVGIVLFSYGDVQGTPAFSGWGIGFMTLGVLCDAMTSNWEKKQIFCVGASHVEAMFFASLFGTFTSVITLFIDEGSLAIEAMAFSIANPNVIFWLIVSSVGGYVSVSFVLLLIKLYSTTYAECVKGLRKVVSIILSYVLITSSNKKFSNLHFIGMVLFVASIVMTIYEKYTQNAQKTKTKGHK